jgi:hypothetical protein
MDNAGKIIVSVVTLLMFAATVTYICVWGVTTEAKDLVNQVIGAEITWVATVVGFWVGSSIGSARKDQTIREQLANPGPTIPPPKADQ